MPEQSHPIPENTGPTKRAEAVSRSEGKGNRHEGHFEIYHRRKLLKAAGLGLVGVVAGTFFPSIYESVESVAKKKELEISIDKLEKELSEKYRIEIKLWHEPQDGGPEGERPTGLIKKSLKSRSLYRSCKSLVSLKKVLEHYPPSLIHGSISGIEIVYAVRPSSQGEVADGTTPEAVTSFGGHIIIRAGYQSPMSYEATFCDNLDANVLHHEVAHALTRDIVEEEWKKLDSSAQYVGNDWKRIKGRPKGFAMPYGAKSCSEDIATTAELLFTNPGEVERLTKDDGVLRAKIEFLRNRYQIKGGGKIKF